MTAPELSAAITSAPQWTPGTLPTLADVTGNQGLRNLTYNDRVAAAAAGNPVYQTNAGLTSAAQRAALTNAPLVTPSAAAQQIQDALAARDAAVNAIPAGISQQEAGAQFRSALQQSYDQRAAARAAAGGAPYQALENSPAQINLQPSIDYATGLAAQNAGEVGQAYQRAAGQFQSATGQTLDTAPFAASVRKSLGDLASSYPPGSAAQRAVLDVRGASRQHDQCASARGKSGQRYLGTEFAPARCVRDQAFRAGVNNRSVWPVLCHAERCRGIGLPDR